LDSRELEDQLVKKLTEGEMETEEASKTAHKRLPVKTEIRIQAQIDSIVEETRQYRKMAAEVDNRYSRFDHLLKQSKDK